LLARDLSYVSKPQFDEIDEMVRKTGYLLHKLQKSLWVKKGTSTTSKTSATSATSFSSSSTSG